MYSHGSLVSNLFAPKKKRKQILDINAAVFHPDDFSGFVSSAEIMFREQSRTEEERAARTALEKSQQEEVEKIERTHAEICAEHFINASLRNVIYANEIPLMNEEPTLYYKNNIVLDLPGITSLCMETRKQSESPNSSKWFDARRVRISASSKAHSIKGLTKKTADTLASEFVAPKSAIKTKGTDWGLRKEKIALAKYQEMNKVDVYRVGLFVSPSQPWLSASVDGVVVEDLYITKILEIKCPISCRTKPIYNPDADTKPNVGYLHLVNGNLELRKGHQYYTQVQVQLYVTGMTVCDFFVWSPRGSCTVQIHRDETFLSTLLPKLHCFFFSNFLPMLCRKDKMRTNEQDKIEGNNNNII